MSRLVGILNKREIYDNDRQLIKWQGDAAYVAVWGISDGYLGETRCDYCGRKVAGDECKGCGAPVRGK